MSNEKKNLQEMEKLFRQAIFFYLNVEIGAPAIYWNAPFGGKEKNFLLNIANITGHASPDSLQDVKKIANIYIEFCTNFPMLIDKIRLKPGTYYVPDVQEIMEELFVYKNEDLAITTLSNYVDEGFRNAPKKQVEITHHHFALLENIDWFLEHQLITRWPIEEIDGNEFSDILLEIYEHSRKPEHQSSRWDTPFVTGDPKRPYGDRTYYYWDIEDMNLLDIKANGEFYESANRNQFSEEQEEFIDTVHRELPLVLQAMAWFGEIGDI